jgi:dTMP kinase
MPVSQRRKGRRHASPETGGNTHPGGGADATRSARASQKKLVLAKPLTPYAESLPTVDTGNLSGKLIVIEGPDAVGRSTQVAQLRLWLEQEGHAVLDTGMARSALAGKGIAQAKGGNTLGPVTMTLYYVTDFADRLENEIIPALRAGFVVLTDRYIFSIMARAIARGEDPEWIERVCGFGLVPHAVYYLRANVKDLVSRVVIGRGAFDYWESGMDYHFGSDMYESFINYQRRLIRALDRMAARYGFVDIDAGQPPETIFHELQAQIAALQLQKVNGAGSPVPSNRSSSRRVGKVSV